MPGATGTPAADLAAAAADAAEQGLATGDGGADSAAQDAAAAEQQEAPRAALPTDVCRICMGYGPACAAAAPGPRALAAAAARRGHALMVTARRSRSVASDVAPSFTLVTLMCACKSDGLRFVHPECGVKWFSARGAPLCLAATASPRSRVLTLWDRRAAIRSVWHVRGVQQQGVGAARQSSAGSSAQR
jgi:hypothetical protein